MQEVEALSLQGLSPPSARGSGLHATQFCHPPILTPEQEPLRPRRTEASRTVQRGARAGPAAGPAAEPASSLARQLAPPPPPSHRAQPAPAGGGAAPAPLAESLAHAARGPAWGGGRRCLTCGGPCALPSCGLSGCPSGVRESCRGSAERSCAARASRVHLYERPRVFRVRPNSLCLPVVFFFFRVNGVIYSLWV